MARGQEEDAGRCVFMRALAPAVHIGRLEPLPYETACHVLGLIARRDPAGEQAHARQGHQVPAGPSHAMEQGCHCTARGV